MARKAPWYWRLEANPVVITIGTMASLVTIASYQWPGTEGRIGVTLEAAGEPPAPAAVGASQVEPPAPAAVGTIQVEPPVSASRGAGQPALPVVMTFPRDGQAVDQFTDMSFDMTGDVPPGYTPVAYVRDPLGQYWSFGPIAPGAPKRVQVGTRDDRGRDFEMGIWITNQDFPRGGPFQDPPAGVGHSAVRVLRR